MVTCNLLALPLRRQHDPLDHLPNDGLAVGRRGARGMPQGWQIGGQLADGGALRGPAALGLVQLEPLVLVLPPQLGR